MSNRTMLEINHDHIPMEDSELMIWARAMRQHLNTGDPVYLPKGVTFFSRRHHADPCPLGEPPHGWDNTK